MQKYGVNELRRMFLEFFESKDHLAMKSFSLVPHNDNSVSVQAISRISERPPATAPSLRCWETFPLEIILRPNPSTGPGSF